LWAQIFFLRFSSQRLIISELWLLSIPTFLMHKSLLVLLQFYIILVSRTISTLLPNYTASHPDRCFHSYDVTSDLTQSTAGDNFIFLQAQSHFSHSQQDPTSSSIPSSEGISKGTPWIDLSVTFISVLAINTRLRFALFKEMALWRYKRGAGG